MIWVCVSLNRSHRASHVRRTESQKYGSQASADARPWSQHCPEGELLNGREGHQLLYDLTGAVLKCCRIFWESLTYWNGGTPKCSCGILWTELETIKGKRNATHDPRQPSNFRVVCGVKWLAQGHTGAWWRAWCSNLDWLLLAPFCFHLTSLFSLCFSRTTGLRERECDLEETGLDGESGEEHLIRGHLVSGAVPSFHFYCPTTT